MKERGMIFNGEMVRAILDGRKTQTRHYINPQPELTGRSGFSWKGCTYGSGSSRRETNENFAHVACPFGKVGDRIWVRETFRFPSSLDDVSPSGAGEMAMATGYKKPWSPTFYESTGSFGEGWGGFETPPPISNVGKLRPSVHMPRWASRITLEITGVRVERLSSISTESARAEGYPVERAIDGGTLDPWLWFRDLWDGIYPDRAFKNNPWVWVIEFKIINS